MSQCNLKFANNVNKIIAVLNELLKVQKSCLGSYRKDLISNFTKLKIDQVIILPFYLLVIKFSEFNYPPLDYKT